MLKKAQYKAERDMYHLEERFEREMGVANHEIRHLRVRPIQIPFVNGDTVVTYAFHLPTRRSWLTKSER